MLSSGGRAARSSAFVSWLRGAAGALLASVLLVLLSAAARAQITNTTIALVTGTVNAPYLTVVSAAGSEANPTFSVTGGALPTGLALTPSGTIYGAPSVPGVFYFTLTETGPVGTRDSRPYVINILGHPVVARVPTASAITSTTARLGGSITVDGLPSLVVRGIAYARTEANANPFPHNEGVPMAWTSGTSGAFAIDVAGLVPGTSYSYRIYAVNYLGPVYSSVGTFTTLESGTFTLTTVKLPNPGLNTPGYSQRIEAIGGREDYTFHVTSGTLPPGLSLSPAGILSGTATTEGKYTFLVSATDLDGAVATRAFTLTIALPAMLGPSSGDLPNPGLNVPDYSHPIVGYGGSGSYTFNLTGGALPSGLSLSRAGTISGKATSVGSYTFTVTVTDSAGAVASRAYTLVVAAPVPVTLATSTLNSVSLGGGPYSAHLSATGGTGPYTFLVSSGGLPPGLTLTATGNLSGVPTSAGTYLFTIVATDSLGVSGSKAYTLDVHPAALAVQSITFGALANKVTTDAPFSLSATASSGLPVSFTASGPATLSGSTLTLTGQPGAVLVTAAQTGNASFAAAPSVTQAFTVTLPTDRLVNLSARVRIAPDASRSLISGFVIGGTQSKRVLVRAIGPTLSVFGITGALINPRLQIFNSAGAAILDNDDWSGADTAAAFTQVNAFVLAAGSRDAALLATLAPGSYTMQITAGTETGIGLAEVYDASANPGAETQRLVNISTRGMVEAGDGLLIGGFVVSGGAPKKVLVRGIGPRLAVFGVADALADPRLAVYSGQTVIAQNDNWSAPQPVNAAPAPATASELIAVARSVGAFALDPGSLDAAVLVTLPPGAYTAQVSASGTSTGVALVEIYEVP